MDNTMHQLIEQHIPYADRLVSQKMRMLPKFIDAEELKSAAYLGLVEAATRYEPEMSVKFTTFSFLRIIGAMNDYLREQGWMKRGEYQQILSLDVPSTDSEDCTLLDTIEARPQDDTEENFEVITLHLDDQAKAVLRFYFIEEYSMKEVGDKFGVSESRISQLIKIYKNKIRDAWSMELLLAELAA